MSTETSPEIMRLVEALLFASDGPLDEAAIKKRLPEEANLDDLMAALAEQYAARGVNLVRAGSKWFFRTAPDLAPLLKIETEVRRRLSRAAVETLAIVAYHQPVTRAEIEEIRGVSQSRGTLDVLLEAGWIKPGRRRRTPGRPGTWVTTDRFLEHFGLTGLDALPGIDELKASGLLDTRPALSLLREQGEITPAGITDVEEAAEAEEKFDISDLQSGLIEAEEP